MYCFFGSRNPNSIRFATTGMLYWSIPAVHPSHLSRPRSALALSPLARDRPH